MRPSKSRSRNKSNRNRTVGNIVNRVFDSSGPEGKVRGTPQQIIDKYNQLARDAQLAGDRVATENFQQHAEHYQRMLNEAQREQEARREEHERQNRDRQQERDRERGQGGQGGRIDPAEAPQPDVLPTGPETETASSLVETPEGRAPEAPVSEDSAPSKKPATRKPRTRKPRPESGNDGGPDSGAVETTG